MVITVHDKEHTNQVCTLFLEHVHDGQEFLLVDRVIELRTVVEIHRP